ncbi:hypothetical protein [Botrimarina sp.]|uniref:PilW family protein n=1 Tax=Botrimarina sp. TaxID=2795802 RepID=UPI0032EC41CA
MTHRAGYTLVELLLATATASVLMVGLASALYVSARALDLDASSVVHVDEALARITADARTASRFRELTPTAIEFDVPDRDGDGSSETLRYEWSGVAGEPLLHRINGGAGVPLLGNVDSVDFRSLTRAVTALDVTVVPEPAWPIFLGVSAVAKATDPTNLLTVQTPPDTAAGDLLVAAVALDREHTNDIYAMGDWVPIAVQPNGSDVALAAYWRIASDAEPATHTWGWGPESNAMGWIIRVSNHDPAEPIAAHSAAPGKSRWPAAPQAMSPLDNCLAIRLGAFKDGDVTAGSPGLAGHDPVLMDDADGKVSGGCGYRVWKPAGVVGESFFALTGEKEFAAMTVMIAPASD